MIYILRHNSEKTKDITQKQPTGKHAQGSRAKGHGAVMPSEHTALLESPTWKLLEPHSMGF